MIRLGQRIVAERTRISSDAGCLVKDDIWRGIRQFSNDRAEELCGSAYLAELRKIGQVTFSISHIASNVFRVSEQAARRKIQLWGAAGVVEKIGEIPNPPNRPLYLFGVTDPRVALAVMSSTDVDLLIANIMISCPSCGSLCITDRNEIHCLSCSTESVFADGTSLLDLSTR